MIWSWEVWFDHVISHCHGCHSHQTLKRLINRSTSFKSLMDPCHFPTACAPAGTIQTSTFYPSIRMKNTEVASLQPLCIGICFPGTLPRHLLQGVIVLSLPSPSNWLLMALFLANSYICFYCRGVQIIHNSGCGSSCFGRISLFRVLFNFRRREWATFSWGFYWRF